MRKMCIFIALLFMASGNVFADMVSKQYVEQQIGSTVSTSGDQEIDGTKTYNASPVIPTPDLPQAESSTSES